MSGINDLVRASALLSEQIEMLASLRNASTRDPNFKQWRQNAVTAIQRIWPGDVARSERFRRIPFTPPSSKAETKAVREIYERGCAEAAVYLRALLTELEVSGVPVAGAAPRPASLNPGVAEDDFPTLDLPGGPARLAETPAETAAPPAPAAPLGEAPRDQVPDDAPAPAKAPAKSGTRPPKNGRKGSSRARLKDMLGFADHPLHPEVIPQQAPAAPAAPAAPEPVDAEAVVREVRSLAAESLAAESDVERAMADFLRMSPVLSSQARPVRRPPVEAPFNAPAALTLAALAADIEALDVPEGHRARARAQLLDLARRIDAHDLTWDVLRDGVAFVMEFPSIGRRVLPLLVPYLDQAA